MPDIDSVAPPSPTGFLYKLLNNRIYIGEAVHKGTGYPGEHRAIITRTLWDKVHSILRGSPRIRAARTRASTPALLKGLIFGPTGCAMSPTHTRRGDKLYRYDRPRTIGPEETVLGPNIDGMTDFSPSARTDPYL